MMSRCRIVILGLTITSSWGNGHATTYRGLVRELARRRHDVLFLERDVEWYASNRDLPVPAGGRMGLYSSVAELKDRFSGEIARADLVIQGSYVPDGIEVGEWLCASARGVTAFYDIDTPVTLVALAESRCPYLSRALIPRFDLYLSFTGGPTIERLECEFGARRARPLYCSFDPDAYYPERVEPQWDLGYMGTYAADRQPGLERLLLDPARRSDYRFVVAGPGYTADQWPRNVTYLPHVPARRHREFYTSQRFTLNLTRADMIRAGHCPSVRLFEAAACGVPIISDFWHGLDALFRPGSEILISGSAEETLRLLTDTPERERVAIGHRGRQRVLAEHTAEHRVIQLEQYFDEVRKADVAGNRTDPAAAWKPGERRKTKRSHPLAVRVPASSS